MTKFNINLGRGHLFGHKTRRLIYHLFVAYLLICGSMITILCYRSVSNLLLTHEQEQQIKSLDHAFSLTHPDSKGIREYHSELLKKLELNNSQLGSLNDQIAPHQPISPILVELIDPLPPSVSLYAVKYELEQRLIQFSVIIPRNDSPSPISSDQLIKIWKTRPLISDEIENITAIYSDSSIVDQQAVYVVRFRCILKERV